MNKDLEKFISEFKDNNQDCTILFAYVAGSHFFNLNSVNSDLDFKLIFLPSPKDFASKNKRKTHRIIDFKTNKSGKNSNEDVDILAISLPRYLELLRDGDFNLMETLFCPEDKIIIDSPLMKELRDDKYNLLVKDASSFLGFFRSEYKKYGININNHKNRLDFCKFLEKLPVKNGVRIQSHWDRVLEFKKENPDAIAITETKTGENVFHPTVVVGDRMFQWRTKISYVIEQLNLTMKSAGHRQKKMAENGKEYKGLYHAQRLIYEGTELITNHKLIIPLPKKQHDFLRRIKDGAIGQDELFKALKDSLKRFERLEQTSVHNNDTIRFRIDSIANRLHAKMEILYLINNKKTPN